MVNYISKIIIPFVKKCRKLKKSDNQVALVIFDEFKGQVHPVTQACCDLLQQICDLLQQNNILFVRVPLILKH